MTADKAKIDTKATAGAEPRSWQTGGKIRQASRGPKQRNPPPGRGGFRSCRAGTFRIAGKAQLNWLAMLWGHHVTSKRDTSRSDMTAGKAKASNTSPARSLDQAARSRQAGHQARPPAQGRRRHDAVPRSRQKFSTPAGTVSRSIV